MSVGILVITHGGIGRNMLDTAEKIFPQRLNLPIVTLAVENDCARERICARIKATCDQLNENQEGVLILTDLYGATPSNLACALHPNYPIMIVSGVSLPMLLKVINHAELDLPSLAHKAVEGGHQGVCLIEESKPTGMIH